MPGEFRSSSTAPERSSTRSSRRVARPRATATPTRSGPDLGRAELDLARGRLDAAEAADRAILDECRTRLGPDDRLTIAAGLALARVREARGDRDAAAALLQAAARIGPQEPDRPRYARRGPDGVGPVPARRRGLDRGRGLLREALAIREVEMPQHWLTAEARSLLGGALLGQKKTAEAAPLLRSGYEGMARSAAAIPLVDRPRLAEALDRLIAAARRPGRRPSSRRGRPSGRSSAPGEPKP